MHVSLLLGGANMGACILHVSHWELAGKAVRAGHVNGDCPFPSSSLFFAITSHRASTRKGTDATHRQAMPLAPGTPYRNPYASE